MSFGSGWTRLFTYDALGRRVQVTADDGVNPPSVIRLFYDGWRAIEEQDDTGGTLATYVHGRYLDDVLSMRRDTDGDMIPEDLFFHKDEMANVFAVSDAAGLVAERYDYDDFGAPRYFNGAGLPIPGSAIGHPYLFAGRRYDEETACTTSTTTTSTRAPGASRRATPSGLGRSGEPGQRLQLCRERPLVRFRSLGTARRGIRGLQQQRDDQRAGGPVHGRGRRLRGLRAFRARQRLRHVLRRR